MASASSPTSPAARRARSSTLLLEGLRRVRAPRRDRRRREHGRRRGRPASDPAALAPEPGCGLAMVFLRDEAARPRVEDGVRGRRARARRLARGARRPGGARRRRRARRCRGSSSSSSRRAGLDAGRGRAARLPRAQARRARERRLRRVALVPHGHLQGALRRRPARRLLRRPARSRARGPVRDLPPALLDEHRALVGARAAVPPPLPQRRDQHDPAATSTGCARARARLGSGRRAAPRPSLDETAPTRRCSTTRSSCSSRGGRDVRHALTMLVRRRGRATRELDPEVRDFYRYHAGLVEPWDGPAALVFTDGRVVGAALDRNGLRPLRYAVGGDGLVACASEAGVVDLAGRARCGAAGSAPAQMLVGRPRSAALEEDADVKRALAARAPYGAWLAAGVARLAAASRCAAPDERPDARARRCSATRARSCAASCARSASHGHEPTSSMGDDTALPPLAGRARPLYSFFRQRFAQVTNPPIDHLRERCVMSLGRCSAPRAPLLEEGPEAARAARARELLPLSVGASTASTPSVLDATFAPTRASRPPASGSSADAERGRPRRRGDACCSTMRRPPTGARSDPGAARGRRSAHRALVEAGLRTLDDARRRERRAARGAPLRLPARLRRRRRLPAARARDGRRSRPRGQARRRPPVAGRGAAQLPPRGRGRRPQGDVEDGHLRRRALLRRRSCSRRSGSRDDVLGAASRARRRPLGGSGSRSWSADVRARHEAARSKAPELENPGYVKFRKGGEPHATNPEVVARAAAGRRPQLRAAVNGDGWDDYERFAQLVNEREPLELRDLLELVPAAAAGSAGPGRARRVDPAPLLERRHVARLALRRGARDGGDRLQPARRPLQLGRRRRGSRALRRRAQLCASSRSPRRASVLLRATRSRPTSSRSRSRRARSPARAASCRPTRSATRSRACGTRGRASS